MATWGESQIAKKQLPLQTKTFSPSPTVPAWLKFWRGITPWQEEQGQTFPSWVGQSLPAQTPQDKTISLNPLELWGQLKGEILKPSETTPQWWETTKPAAMGLAEASLLGLVPGVGVPLQAQKQQEIYSEYIGEPVGEAAYGEVAKKVGWEQEPTVKLPAGLGQLGPRGLIKELGYLPLWVMPGGGEKKVGEKVLLQATKFAEKQLAKRGVGALEDIVKGISKSMPELQARKIVEEAAEKAGLLRWTKGAKAAGKIPEVAPKVGGTVPPTRVTSTTPLGEGALRESEHFRKVNERLGGELGDNPLYNQVNLADQAKKAIKFVSENSDDARKITLGYKNPPEGLLDTAISTAYEQRMFDAGDLNEFTKAVNSLSLRKTRAGQEIAALRGVVSDTSPTYFVEQVIAERVNRVGNKLPKGTGVPVTPQLRVARAVGKEVEQLTKVVNSKKVDILEAQKLIDSLGVAGDRLKVAFKNGELTMNGLYNMTSGARRAAFERLSSPEAARTLNVKFEKAMLSKQKDALQNWARSITDIKKRKTVLDKINELEKMGALDTESTNGFLSDLVASKLGIEATPAEVAKIKSMSEGLEGLFATVDPVLGIPDTEYWVARKGLDNYINSLNPAHRLKVATSIIGRGSMLFSVKSPLTNIISNTVMAAVEGFQRRILNVSYRGLNGKFGFAYVKKVNQIFQKSGYDISRLDVVWPSQVRLGEEVTSAQGAGAVRKVGRFYEDVVFKQLMGAPDVASSSVAFADSVDLMSTRIAKTEGLVGETARTRALEIFKDAIKIEPTTPEGVLARAQGIADARFTTYTNKSGYSDVAMGIRKVMNKMSGDLRLGDQLMPFVKTPSNVVSAGMDAAGVGFFKGFYKLPKAIKAMKTGDPLLMRETIGDFTRAGLGLTLATVLAYAIGPEDFVGDYDALSIKEREMAVLKNAPYNSIRIGDKWISLDYFGPLASAFVGIMYARKYGENLPMKIAKYSQGAGSQLLRFPGLTEVSDMIANVKEAATSGDYGKTAMGITDQLVAFIRARVIPAIVSDSARALDTKERMTTGILSKTMAGIPGLRQTLPEKVERTTGGAMPTENPISTLLFGSRLKTVRDNAVISEINRLYGIDATPTIRDIEKSSARVQALQDQLGEDEWTQALSFYGRNYGNKVSNELIQISYQRLSDEDKMGRLNSLRSDAVDEMIREYQKTEILKPLSPQAQLNHIFYTTENNIWAQYPPNLRTLSDQIIKLENSDNRNDQIQARQLLMQHPEILAIRRKVAIEKARVKREMVIQSRR